MERLGGTLIWVSLVLTVIWLSVDASRVFKDEVRWKTLSSLTMLPYSVREIAYRKVIGALAGTLPLLGGLFLGCLLAPNGVGEFLNDIFREPTAFGAFVMVILQFILFLHLVAFLSLLIKRGALPLAIGIQYLGGSFFFGFVSMIFMMVRSPGALLFVTGFICPFATLTAVLHTAIGYRLSRLVAQE